MTPEALERVYSSFYRIPRLGGSPPAGVGALSDGGGPFGFDIVAALEADYCITSFDCDAIIECGCHVGDTTTYLARTYPHLTLYTCDVLADACAWTSRRTRHYDRVHVTQEDSRELLRRIKGRFRRPFIILDAHGAPEWPLPDELEILSEGIVMIDDFDIGVPGYSYDTYGGQRINETALASAGVGIDRVYVNNPDFVSPLPLLQLGRRAGRAYYPVAGSDEKFCQSRMFRALQR